VDDHRPGDKVRIRSGPLRGSRGRILKSREGAIEIELDLDGTVQRSLSPDVVTNYSRAARRAWAHMPKRAGRPRFETPRTKMVSLRLDVDVVNQLAVAAEFGLIPNRERAINDWVRERLRSVLRDLPDLASVATDRREPSRTSR